MSTETEQGGSGERQPEAPTESLVSASVGDRCVNCGTPLASDQRYCTVCGERRGAARFSLPTATAAAAAPPPAPRRDSRRPRVSSGATLVAGVGTLLLAIGVGVLIGHDSSSNNTATTAAATPVKVITVGGGTAAPAATTGSSSSTGAGSSGASSSTGGASKSKSKSTSKGGKSKTSSKKSASSSAASKTNAAAAAAAAKAAAKVTGGSGASAPATVTVGQSAPKGTPGTNKKGKFTGSFFGGG